MCISKRSPAMQNHVIDTIDTVGIMGMVCKTQKLHQWHIKKENIRT